MTEQPDRINTLSLSVDNLPTTTTIVFTQDLEGIEKGSRIEIDQEIMFVLSISGKSAGSNAQVIRAFSNSTIASHNAGAIIRVNPQFFNTRIASKINRCLEGLSGHGLFAVDSYEFTYTPAKAGYELVVPGFLDVLSVRYDYPGPLRDWPILLREDYFIDQTANATDFSSGISLTLRRGGYPGRKVQVTYKKTYSPLVNLSDDVELVSGLHATAHEIPPMGAAMRLLYGREIKRSFLTSQPNPRRAREVPPGSASDSMRGIAGAYYEAIDREVRVLTHRYRMQTH